MKKLLTIVLAAILLLSCFPAMAEENAENIMFIEDLGVTLNLTDLMKECTNSIFVENDGVIVRDPEVALATIIYYGLPQETLNEIINSYDQASEEEQQMNTQLLRALSSVAAYIIVSNAPDQAAMAEAIGLQAMDGVEVKEAATLNSWHYYLVTIPVDGLLEIYDNPDILDETYTEEMAKADQAAIRTDVDLIHSRLFQQLETGKLVEPVDPSGRLIGQTLEFETTDLDGNTVKSADLFKDNKITMVNLWGTWCSNCINEMAELAQLHIRLQEKGCGIVGLESELKPIETVADTARGIMTANGITYPNVIAPMDNPILAQFDSFPTTLFVDSDGKILTYPIVGAVVSQYEPTIEALLAGESVNISAETGAVANGDNKYCVYV